MDYPELLVDEMLDLANFHIKHHCSIGEQLSILLGQHYSTIDGL
jgi:hypothetical protein